MRQTAAHLEALKSQEVLHIRVFLYDRNRTLICQVIIFLDDGAEGNPGGDYRTPILRLEGCHVNLLNPFLGHHSGELHPTVAFEQPAVKRHEEILDGELVAVRRDIHENTPRIRCFLPKRSFLAVIPFNSEY